MSGSNRYAALNQTAQQTEGGSPPTRYDALNQTTQQLDESQQSKRAEQLAAGLQAGSNQTPDRAPSQEGQEPRLKDFDPRDAISSNSQESDAYWKAYGDEHQKLVKDKGYTPNEATYILARQEQGTDVPKPQDPQPRSQGQAAGQTLSRATDALERAIALAEAINARKETELGKDQDQSQEK